jgi:cytochrome c biogenesis protein CcmG/thiol:disulfide interchange protein DsbE
MATVTVRRAPSRWFLAVVVVVPLLIAGLVGYAVRQASHTTTQMRAATGLYLVVYPPAKQKVAPTATLPRLGGGAPVILGGATGHPRVVNFFASWCPLCREELSALASVARSSGVSFVGVDTDDTAPGTARSLLAQAGATYPVGVAQAPLAESYGAAGLPTTAFVNGRGKIVAIYLGRLTRSQLSTYVNDLRRGKRL